MYGYMDKKATVCKLYQRIVYKVDAVTLLNCSDHIIKENDHCKKEQ